MLVEPCPERRVRRALTFCARALSPFRIQEPHSVEIGYDKRLQLQKFKKRIENLRMRASSLNGGDILTAELAVCGEISVQNLRYARHQNPFGGSFHKYGLVREIQVALRERHILLKKATVLGADCFGPATEILDLGAADAGMRCGLIQKIADCVELSRIGEV